jgi:hypothetical protein
MSPDWASLVDRRLQIGEFANDYIEVRRQYSDWSAFKGPDVKVPIAGDRHHIPLHHSDEASSQSSNEKILNITNDQAPA